MTVWWQCDDLPLAFPPSTSSVSSDPSTSGVPSTSSAVSKPSTSMLAVSHPLSVSKPSTSGDPSTSGVTSVPSTSNAFSTPSTSGDPPEEPCDYRQKRFWELNVAQHWLNTDLTLTSILKMLRLKMHLKSSQPWNFRLTPTMLGLGGYCYILQIYSIRCHETLTGPA